MRSMLPVVLLLAISQFFAPMTAQAQDSAHAVWVPPYKLDTPKGWTTEHFSLPPEFARQIPYKGTEDLRFAHGWADAGSEEHWAYAFVWWLEGRLQLTTDSLQSFLKDYYSGLVERNIVPRKIPKEKLIPVKTSFRIIATQPGDRTSFSGTIHMLDYLTQTPMTLNVIVHWKYLRSPDHTAVMFEVSPKPMDHHIWQQLNELNKGLRLP
jgi:hypothetical protein